MHLLLPPLDYVLKRLDLNLIQLDVPVLLTHLSLALNHLSNQPPSLLLTLLDLAPLSLKSLPHLSP